jgi:hypothetical protein
MLAGLRIESDFPLTGLASADPMQPDFGRIRIRRVSRDVLSYRAEAEPSAILMTQARLGLFLVTGRDEILVAPVEDARDRSIFAFLFGPCFAAIAYLNGVLPLHGSAIETPGGMVAFAGGCGAGKSTLAAALAARGHTIHSDDVCLLRNMQAGGISSWPGIRWLRLTDEAARVLDRIGSTGAAPSGAKHNLRLEHPPDPISPRPLRAVYALERTDPGEAASITRLLGGRAAERVLANAYRSHLARQLGLWPRVVPDCVAIADRTPVFLFRRAFDYARLPETLGMLESHIAAHAIQDGPL